MKFPLQKVLATGSLRVSGLLLQTFVILLVGRVAGPAGVGVLQLFLTWTCTLGELVAAGLPTQSMRKLATMNEQKANALEYFYRAVVRMTHLWLGLMSGALLMLLTGLISSGTELGMIGVSLFSFALYRIASESLKAFSDLEFSVFVESTLPPLIAAAILLVLHGQNVGINGFEIMAAFSLGFLVTALTLVLRLFKRLERASHKRRVPATIEWKEHAPYWVTALVSIGFLNYPFFVLPYFSEVVEIGAFALVFKLLNIGTTVLLLLGSMYGPKFAKFADSGNLTKSKELLFFTQKISLAIFLPIALVLIALFPFIHSWFGSGFESGYPLLLILCFGQLVNAATGLSGQLLNMYAQGSVEMKIQLAGLLLAIVLTPVAGSTYGVTGIALVYSLAIAAKSLGSLWWANKLVTPRYQLAT